MIMKQSVTLRDLVLILDLNFYAFVGEKKLNVGNPVRL